MLMNFERALSYVKAGGAIAREGWNGKGLSVHIQRPDATSKMTLPYLHLQYPDGTKVPWIASQTDLLSDDWIVAGILKAEKEAI